MHRRDFLKIMGVASSSTLMTSCDLEKQSEKLIPYLLPPEEEIIPGQSIYYNTTCTECPACCGVSVKDREKVYNNLRGRYPVKLEGIPGHPVNDGTLCIRGQASLTRLYHPDRIKKPKLRDSKGNFTDIDWSNAYSQILDALRESNNGGYKNIYLSGRTTGSLSDLIDDFCKRTGIERAAEFEVYSHSAIKEANGILFSKREIPLYQIDKADYLLTIGADILETFISPVSNAVRLSHAKRKSDFKWFHIEPHVSLTGFQACEKFTINPGTEVYLLDFLLKNMLNMKLYKERLPEEVVKSIPDFSQEEVSSKTGLKLASLYQIADQFKKAKMPLLIAGGISTRHSCGLETAVLTGLIQWITGMTDSVIDFSRAENYSSVGTMVQMEKLSNRLSNNEIGVIFIARTDPSKSIPVSYFFKENIKKAKLRIGLSDLLTGTIKECDIILPLSHTFESWGDANPRSGLKTLIQPALEPLFKTLSEGDILLHLLKGDLKDLPFRNFQEYLFKKWNENYGKTLTEEFLKKGYYEESVPKKEIRLDNKSAVAFLKNIKTLDRIAKPVLVVTPSIRSFDGRSSVLPLLNEIPDPLTTISYGQWVSVPPKTAKSLMLSDGDEVEISAPGLSARLPVKVQPGLPEDTFAIHPEMLSTQVFQADKRSGEGVCYLDKIKIIKTGASVSIPVLSGSMSQKGRGIVPNPVNKKREYDRGWNNMYPEHKHKDYRWAMAVDLELCIACSACVAACYIENNVPVVGKRHHLMGLEMSWLRVEPFFNGHGKCNFVLMLCQHCDYAPCEPVCPVFASYHNPEGLNIQLYNRCVGTRYCSNNCPYKVRRFNWFDSQWPEPLDRMLNPDISVRTKGVMEKCTFCVQRIREAHDTAKDESRKIRDQEVVTACAQTCPTNAIVFGNILDKESQVYKLAHSERVYRIFEPLGTEPSVYYLRKKGDKNES